jgi:hypothetical protein
MKKMGRDRKLVEAQIEGLCRAFTIVKQGEEHGLEDLKKEIEFRNITYTPLSYDKQVILDYLTDMTENILSTVMLLSLSVLHDEFGFGKTRAEKYMQRYALKTECLRDYAITNLTWEDVAQDVKDNLGFDFNIDWEAWKNYER